MRRGTVEVHRPTLQSTSHPQRRQPRSCHAISCCNERKHLPHDTREPNCVRGQQHASGAALIKRAFSAPGASSTTKIPRKRPKEREKKTTNCGGRGKKKRGISGLPPFGPPTLRGPTLRGPTSGPQHFLCLAPPHPWGPHHDTKKYWPKNWIELAKIGAKIGLAKLLAKTTMAKATMAKNGLAKTGLAKVGLFPLTSPPLQRTLDFGQFDFGQTGPPGFAHDSPKKSKRAHFRAPALQNHQNLTRRPGEGRKERIFWRGRKKKSEILGGPGEGGPGEGRSWGWGGPGGPGCLLGGRRVFGGPTP